MTIAGSLKQEEWVLNETFFFLLLLLGFFFFPLFTRLSDLVKVLFFCSTVKNKFYLYITMLSLSFLQVIA